MTAPAYILVVDDDPDVQTYLQLALARLGLPVRTAEAMPDELPAVALVDLLLGDRDGLPLIVALCAQRVPVVAISGLDAASKPMQAAQAAGAVLLCKPFSLADLRTVVSALLAATPPPQGGGAGAR